MEMTVNRRADAGKSMMEKMDFKYSLGQACVSDLESVRRLELETYGDDAYSYVVLRQFLDMSGELFQVCRDIEGNVIAYGIVARSASQNNGWFHSIVVSAAHRRKGIGAKLGEQLMKKADSCSLGEVFLTVSPGNKSSMSLCRKLGFSDVKFERHYFGQNRDRIIMRRSMGRQSCVAGAAQS